MNETTPSNQKPKIAIIEDDIAIVQMYRTKFELEGCEVQTAGDGASGLDMVEKWQPDIVLADLMMPGMGGLEMIERLRANPETKDIKIIVLTNMGDTETAQKVYKMAATDYIVKAEMTPKQVFERVQKLLATGQ